MLHQDILESDLNIINYNPKIVAVLNKNISIRVIQRVFLSFTKFNLQGVGLVISIYVNCMKRATKIYQNI